MEQLPLQARLRPLPASRAAEGADAILNLAVLADTAVLDQFRDTVDDLSRISMLDGFVLEVTGPWPPYSFCDEESTAAVDLAQLVR